MTTFNVVPLRTNTVAYVYRLRSAIQLDPLYQRQGEVWSREKQRLLIDSIINQFDIPKIYFHEHRDGVVLEDGREVRYSLVDGRQRLEAVWDFLDGKFALSADFVFMENGSVTAAGLTYKELEELAPELAALLSATPLDIMLIQTDDVELIEEMFSRLNEAVPLNAAEKRNGRGGPLRPVVRSLCGNDFFARKLPFGNTRYRHYDLATKFLLFAKEGATDTKKRSLDDFWEDLKGSNDVREATKLQGAVTDVLDAMMGTFEDGDKLLSSAGMLSLYFLLFQDLIQSGAELPEHRELVNFDAVRRLKRFDDEEQLSTAQRRLLEFDRLAQSPNDESALKYRLEVIEDYLRDPKKFR